MQVPDASDTLHSFPGTVLTLVRTGVASHIIKPAQRRLWKNNHFTARTDQSSCESTPHERLRADHVCKNRPVRIEGGAVLYERPRHSNHEPCARYMTCNCYPRYGSWDKTSAHLFILLFHGT